MWVIPNSSSMMINDERSHTPIQAIKAPQLIYLFTFSLGKLGYVRILIHIPDIRYE